MDWRAGAAMSYPQAAANTRGVGVVVADFVDYLQVYFPQLFYSLCLFYPLLY